MLNTWACRAPRAVGPRQTITPMKCLNCGHSAAQHNLPGDRRCRVRTLSNWSTQRREYTGSKECECRCYSGIDPTTDTCAHEFLPVGGCVHCGEAKVQQ